MKKTLLKSIASVAIFSLTAGVGTSFAADASFNDLKFYAGAGLDYAKHSVDKSNLNSIGKVDNVKDKGMGLLIPILGVKFHENFGIEAGYSFNRKISAKIDKKNEYSFKLRNAYMDLMGFMPIANQFDLVGGLGLGRLMAKKGSGVSDMEVKNKFGWRAKIGAQYNCTDNVAVRALVAYQHAGNRLKDDKGKEYKFIKNMKSIGLSAIYTF